jgi:deoxyribonuclease-4
VQVFEKSPLQWHAARRDDSDIAAFRESLSYHGIALAATHAAYLINPASPDDGLWGRSIDALADEILRAEQMGAPAVVTHLGSAPSPRPAACERAAAAVARALERTTGCVARVYLENSAGSGSTLGSTPEEILAVLSSIPGRLRSRLAVCIDTCHAHVAGYDLSSARGWSDLLAPFAAAGARVALVHANDARFECGSRRDRHAWIGEGTIGCAGFSLMFRQELLHEAEIVVEMPGETPRKDAVNVARLKELRGG